MLLVAPLIGLPLPVRAQDGVATSGTWAVGRAGDDDLPLRLELSGASASLVQIGALRRWAVLPEDADADSGQPLDLSLAVDGGQVARLGHGSWSTVWADETDGVAVWLSPGVGPPGLGWRLEPLSSELLGDWERAEPTPVGPRLRRLELSAHEVIVYDRLDRPAGVDAAAVRTGWGPALALFPRDEDPSLVRLLAVDGAFVAVASESRPVQVVFRPDAQPAWLDPDWTSAVSAPTGRPSGRWLIGAGDGARLVALLDLDADPPQYARLGSGAQRPVSVLGGGPTHLRLAVGEGHAAQTLDLVVAPEAGWGALWPVEGGSPKWVRRVTPVPASLLGEWTVEADGSWIAEPVRVTEAAVERPLWGDSIPAVGLDGGDAAAAVALLRADRSGRLIRLHRLGPDAWVSETGDLWYRAGARDRLRAEVGGPSCDALAAEVVERLSDCARSACGGGAACGVVDAIAPPLRCTTEQLAAAQRSRDEDCDRLWPDAFQPAW